MTGAVGFIFHDTPRFAMAMMGKVDIVHFHVSVRASFYRKFLLFLIARLAQKKTIVHLHAGNFQRFQSNAGAVTRYAVSWLFGGSNAVIAVSTAVGDELSLYSDDCNGIQVIGNTALAAELAVYERPSAAVGGELPPYVAFAGRITKEKGVHDLMRALALLKQQGCSVQLRLAGSGDIDHWRWLASEYGISDLVTFMGWLDGDAKLEFYRNARLFCMPSHFESFGIATLEAMFAGVPVVGTRVGGFLDLVVDGVTGYLVDPGDPEALAACIRMLIERPTLAENLGSAAAARAHEHYSANAIVYQYVQCYRAVAAQ